MGADVSVDGACVGATDTFLLTAAPASVVGEMDELLEAGAEGEARDRASQRSIRRFAGASLLFVAKFPVR